MVRDGTGRQAMTTAATAHGRGGRHARCCAGEPSSSDATQQQETLHSKWHELAQEDRSSSVSRDASITPNREQEQGTFTLTLRRRR